MWEPRRHHQTHEASRPSFKPLPLGSSSQHSISKPLETSASSRPAKRRLPPQLLPKKRMKGETYRGSTPWPKCVCWLTATLASVSVLHGCRFQLQRSRTPRFKTQTLKPTKPATPIRAPLNRTKRKKKLLEPLMLGWYG